MTPSARVVLLGSALIPYLGLVVADAWMHERARKVPTPERIIHYASAGALVAFLAGVFVAHHSLASASLAVFILLLAVDELGFHRGIAQRERRVHIAAYGALLLFVAVWQWTVTHT